MQFFAQRTPALDEALVDGLVGHLHLRVIGYSRANHAEICWGDHLASSLRSTTPRSRRHWASLARFGRSARRQAARSATSARYFLGPPFALTSRHTVEAERPRASAMARIE